MRKKIINQSQNGLDFYKQKTIKDPGNSEFIQKLPFPSIRYCFLLTFLGLAFIVFTVSPLKAQVVLKQDFEHGSLDPWQSINITGGRVWQYVSVDPDTYGRHAHFSGGKEENEDWLLSPEISLPAQNEGLNFTFDLIYRYGTDNANSLKLLISENFVSQVTEAEWTELDFQMPSPAPSWTTPYSSSGEIDLSAYSGKKIRIALKAETFLTGGNYNNASRIYRVDNFIIKDVGYVPSGDNLPLEDAVSSNWSCSSGSNLSVNDSHYKKGSKSIQWSYSSGDTLFVSKPNIDPDKVMEFYYHTLKLWVYNTEPTGADGLKFQFLDQNGTVQYTFDFGLNYTGWRKILRSYRYDMQGPKTTNHLDQLRIIAPESAINGRILFDNLIYVKERERRFRDLQMPDVGGYLSDTENYDAYFNSYGGSIDPPTPVQLEEMKKIKQSYLQELKGSAPTAGMVEKAKNFFNSLNIIEGEDGIKGKPVDENNIGIFEAPMLNLARHFIHTSDEESRDMIVLITRHLLDQGIAFGSNVIVAGGSKGYSFRKIPDALILMHDQLSEELKKQVSQMFIWQLRLNEFWNESRLSGGNMDDIHVMGSRILGSIISFIEDDGLKIQYLNGFKGHLEKFLAESPGTRGGIKPDGVSFHHKSHYNGYMYAYNTLGNFLYHLKETSFQIDQPAYLQFRKAIMTMSLMSVKTSGGAQYFNFLAGRHPLDGVKFPIQKQTLYKVAKLGGDLLDQQYDHRIAAFYNRIWGDAEEFKDGEAKAPNGFWSFNFSPMGLYRQDDWAVGIKGMHDVFWGSEIYAGANRYGRYLSYGAVEILYEGGNEQSGYDINGWDWNKIPGTTTIDLPFNKLLAEKSRIDEKSGSNFAGALNWNNETGFYGFDFRESDGGGSFYNHNPSFRFQKSMYCIDGKVICLGSGIENNDQDHSTISTIFQNSLNSFSQTVMLNGQEIQENMEISGDAINWLLDSYTTGYIIMPGDNISFTQGSQKSPDESGNGAFTNGEFATAWINHDKEPGKAAYEMIIVPNSSEAEMSQLSEEITSPETKFYNVLKMDNAGHVVKFDGNRIAYTLFSTNSSLPGNILKGNDSPCLVMAETKRDKLKINFVNPNTSLITESSHKGLHSVTLTLLGRWDLDSGYDGDGVSIKKWEGNKTFLNVTTHYGQQREFYLERISYINSISDDKSINQHYILYPNPTEDKVFVQLMDQQQKPDAIIIRNILGDEVYHESFSTYGKSGLDISFLPSGVYLFTLVNGQGMEVRKIIKK
jgi:hypothetical protein